MCKQIVIEGWITLAQRIASSTTPAGVLAMWFLIKRPIKNDVTCNSRPKEKKAHERPNTVYTKRREKC